MRPDWRVVEQINFPALTKLSLAVAEPKDVRAWEGNQLVVHALWQLDKWCSVCLVCNIARGDGGAVVAGKVVSMVVPMQAPREALPAEAL